MNVHTIVWSSLVMQAEADLDPVPLPVPKSTLWWLIETMSWTGLFVLLLSLAIFIVACVVVTKSRRMSTIAAYLILLPLPTYFGILGMLKGIIASLSVIAISNQWPSDVYYARGIAESLLLLFVSLLVTLPSYLVLAYGLLASTRNSSASPTP